MSEEDNPGGYGIAIVGMSLRFPGALTPEDYWRNLRQGVESVVEYSDEELLEAGVSHSLLKNPDYVKSGMPLDEYDCFDPEFFGFSPKEASILDPQHRQFYECAWEAMERASHRPENFDGTIGVYAGCGVGAYLWKNLLTNEELLDSVGMFLLRHTGNDKDFLATRVAYNMNLTGPAVSVQTACSTSSVAIHMACQSLLSEECDMAMAGAVTIELPQRQGYLHKRGEVLSSDGHCRPFDANSDGTVFSSGCGVLVLRRLEDAIEDGDHIHAVISGSAINNDGSSKVGYLAPSVAGQSEAIAEAVAIAGISADDIQYVECHGTGTRVGDPIEIAALTQGFQDSTQRLRYCAVGSVKSNIGHMDTAAGVAGVIKVALAIEAGEIPPSLNYTAPNPAIEFENSPFYVNDKLSQWKCESGVRRAAVNSLGVGGTNCFIILEQAPQKPAPAAEKGVAVLPLSARNRKGLERYADKIASFLRAHPELDVSLLSSAMLHGRKAFEHRRVVSGATAEELADELEANKQSRVFSHVVEDIAPKSVVFMYPGGGTQYVEMGAGLYESDSVFKRYMDAGFEILASLSDEPYRDYWRNSEEQMERPAIQLPLIFLVEYALTQSLLERGIEPAALIGHSMGENTAATVAGVFDFEGALGLVHLRGVLMEQVPRGGMLSVQLSAGDLQPYLADDIDLASINAPNLTVVSGTDESLEQLSNKLAESGIEHQRVAINIAAHSRLLDSVLDEFASYLKKLNLSAPSIPIISNRTGEILTDDQAKDPDYWVQHLRNTVHFADGIEYLAVSEQRVFLEVGPGNVLGSLARQNAKVSHNQVVSTMRHRMDDVADDRYLSTAHGRLWATGLAGDYTALSAGRAPYKMPLPTYPFLRQQYMVEPGAGSVSDDSHAPIEKIEDESEWIRKPVWVQQGFLAEPCSEPETYLIFMDDGDIGQQLKLQLEGQGHTVITVQSADAYYRRGPREYRLSPEVGQEGYSALVSDLQSDGLFPTKLVHLWLLTAEESFRPGSSFFHRNKEYGFYSLFFFARAMADDGLYDSPLQMVIFANGMQQVAQEPLPFPEKATVLGATKVLPQELPGVSARTVDLDLAHLDQYSKAQQFDEKLAELVEIISSEIYAPDERGTFAYRDRVRWQLEYDFARETDTALTGEKLRSQGTYLITGGLGGIGFALASQLANDYQANLILLCRTPLPNREDWQNWTREHGENDPISLNVRKALELEAAGASVVIESCDVTDVVRMRQVVESAEQKFGAIHGVIHAAGALNDSLLQMKSQQEIEDTFAPKIYGTMVLDELFAERQLDFMILFSSTSTITAQAGQMDYVAANSFLNAFAHSRNTQTNTHTLAINWGVWNDVGMAVNSAAQMGFGPIEESSQSHTVSNDLFVDRLVSNKNGQVEHCLNMLLQTDNWILDQHRVKSGEALWPGTGYLELIRAALLEVSEPGPFQVEELTFFQALYVPDGETVRARVKLTRTVSGYDMLVQSLVNEDSEQENWLLHAQAEIKIGAKPETFSEFDALIGSKNWQPAEHDQALESAQEAHLIFGEQWRVLSDYKIFAGGDALALCRLDGEFDRHLSDCALHPGLLDIATGYAMELLPGYDRSASRLWIPVMYRGFQYLRPLTKHIVSWVKLLEGDADAKFASFQIKIFDEHENLLVEVERLTLHQLTEDLDLRTRNIEGSDISIEAKPGGSSDFRQLSPAEVAFQQNLSCGIKPDEGYRVLKRIMAQNNDSEVIASSIGLEAIIESAKESAKKLHKGNDGPSFARPDLDNEYVAPRHEIDRTLIGFWEELLGVEGIGIDDNFFELGGHSLVAVRLFAKIQQKFNVDYPMSVLFEAPTVAQCADLISTDSDVEISGGSEGQSQAENHSSRYTHLVPMHVTAEQDSTPFFLVAGMFGNVLNLRHLAQLMGSHRPFFGLQARGLYGDHAPHETFEEMAADYIEEMRTVQPHGPYLLGGFSGGGITAFEIAKQLLAQGEKVEKLVLLDTPLPHDEPLSTVDRMVIQWQKLKEDGPGYVAKWAINRYRWEKDKLRGKTAQENGEGPSDFQSGDIELAFRRALSRYHLEKLPIDVVLFRPKLAAMYDLPGSRMAGADRAILREDNGWTPYVEKLQIEEVPGDHDSMVLEPNVRVLATMMNQRIEERIAVKSEKGWS